MVILCISMTIIPSREYAISTARPVPK